MQSPVLLHVEWGSVRDQTGSRIDQSSDPRTLIYDATGLPLTAADGHTLAVGEFRAASGGISVKCQNSATTTLLVLAGLIPNSKYSLALAMIGPTGQATMGVPSDDPSASQFTTDQFGQAEVFVSRNGPCYLADDLMTVMQAPIAQILGLFHFTAGNPPGDVTVPQFSFTFARLMRLPNEIRDAKGNMIAPATPDNTPLFEYRKGNPVTAPKSTGGAQITLGEFKQVTGSIEAKCLQGGTHVGITLSGLIPMGVYTIWIAKPDPTNMANMLGFGALGSTDGLSGNKFIADSQGETFISGTNPGGNLSGFGTIAPCWLTGEPMVQVAGVYHIDEQTHGPTAGPDGTYAAQFAFVFAQPPSAQPPSAQPPSGS